MSRVRRGPKARQRRNKIFRLAKGFHFDRRNKFRHTVATVKRALHNAYKCRRLFKRDIRQLWITRIGAAVRMLDSSYSQFMGALKDSKVEINRKMLAELAVADFEGFKAIFNRVHKA